MNRRIILIASLMTLTVLGCKRDNEPNKIIDTLPVTGVQTCVPAQIGQGWFALKRDLLRVLISVINRTQLLNASFPNSYPELTRVGAAGAGTYTFQTTDRHYGTALFTIQFLDSTPAPIDPVSTFASSSTLKSVSIGVTVSGFAPFSGTENLELYLETAGLLDSPRRIVGTSHFNGPTDSMAFALPFPGARGAYEGLVDGEVTATGTGPGGQPITLSLAFSSDHTANGPLTWEGQTGGIHFEPIATGYVITNSYRLLLD